MIETQLYCNKRDFSHLVKQHPCFNSEAHNKFGRIHLPVSPACNIQCRFCKRGFNKCEKRPGVTRTILTSEQAVEKISRALELCPQITVVGIAGPGDTLATDHALKTFELIHDRFPHLIKCLSTNGLLLKDKAKQIMEVGVKTLTVTVNALDPAILNQICSHITYHGRYLTGEFGARLLALAQLAGIKEAAKLGAVVKINTVLIPGVNNDHVEEIAHVTSSLGASMINIIPLIPQHEMGGYRAPTCSELNAAREAAEKYLPVFRHCKQCRADACGIPGTDTDYAEKLYEEPLTNFSHG